MNAPAEDAVLTADAHLEAGRKRLAFETLLRAARKGDAGDDGSNLQIAQLYLSRHRPDQALRHLEAVLRSNQVCEDDHEQAARLLQRLRKPKPRRGKAR